MSNLADLLNDIGNSSAKATSIFGDLMGLMADIGGVIGLVQQLLNLGQLSLYDIQDAINRDFAQLEKQNQAAQILDRNTTLNGYIAPAYTQLQSVKAEVGAHPSPAEIVEFIQPCIDTLDKLGGAVQPDIVWNLTAGWPIYWTDLGEPWVNCPEGGPYPYPVGYFEQDPPLNADGLTVFYYSYSLPLYLFALSILLAVGGSLDPNFVANYADVLRAAISLLKSKHQQIMGGLTQLAPFNWANSGTVQTPCPASGISLIIMPWQGVTGASIKYGAVEKFSGYSSMADGYMISASAGIPVPATYYKFQLRLLKRTKDVYFGVGLRNVSRIIDTLNKLVGDPVLPDPPLENWSFREIVRLSQFPLTRGGYSLRGLGEFIIATEPSDTPYWPDATTFSFRQLLTEFPASPAVSTMNVQTNFLGKTGTNKFSIQVDVSDKASNRPIAGAKVIVFSKPNVWANTGANGSVTLTYSGCIDWETKKPTDCSGRVTKTHYYDVGFDAPIQ